MVRIDGTFGEGGGQILRTSLSLAALTGRELHLENIRGKRQKPGLMRQHLTAVSAVAEICGGRVEGAELDSRELRFTPGAIRGGDYRFVIGSAGSAILVAQTVLPLLLAADTPSRVVIEGGTHAANAPIHDFFERVYLPQLVRMGGEVSVRLERVGFYPAGGGRIELLVTPVRHWKPLELMERGALRRSRLVALSHGIDESIGRDELGFFHQTMKGEGAWEEELREVASPGPGNVLFAELEYDRVTELFSVCGDTRTSRRAVGERVAGLAGRYLGTDVPVGRFLADQLLLPMAFGAGGCFRSLPPTKHTETNIEVIKRFLNVEIEVENHNNGTYSYSMEVKK